MKLMIFIGLSSIQVPFLVAGSVSNPLLLLSRHQALGVHRLQDCLGHHLVLCLLHLQPVFYEVLDGKFS